MPLHGLPLWACCRPYRVWAARSSLQIPLCLCVRVDPYLFHPCSQMAAAIGKRLQAPKTQDQMRPLEVEYAHGSVSQSLCLGV
eukprot:8410751-Pyramimonas_sp.AAC.1